jgi:hypothetical protein
MSFDPFATDVVHIPEQRSASPVDRDMVVATIKGAKSSDPWLVLHLPNVQHLIDYTTGAKAGQLKEAMDGLAKAGQYFQGLNGIPAPAAPQAYQSYEPPSSGESCAHGAMTYREGLSQSTKKPYKGHFCPVKNPGCKPVFVN